MVKLAFERVAVVGVHIVVVIYPHAWPIRLNRRAWRASFIVMSAQSVHVSVIVPAVYVASQRKQSCSILSGVVFCMCFLWCNAGFDPPVIANVSWCGARVKRIE